MKSNIELNKIHRGDCFDLVGEVIRENPSSKVGFFNILDAIAEDFKLHKYENADYVREIRLEQNKTNTKVKSKFVIKYQKRRWNKLDGMYWTRFNITKTILEKFNVSPCAYVWVNDELRYEYTSHNPAYAYDFGNGNIKIYYPLRKKFRFITNTNIVQGLSKVTRDDFVIVTKSYKDVLTLHSFGIQAVAPSSETHLIKREEYEELRSKFLFIFSLMDPDRTGKLMALKLRRVYDMIPLLIKYNVYGEKLNHNSKDLSDLVKEKGVAYAESLIEDTVNYYSDKYEY